MDKDIIQVDDDFSVSSRSPRMCHINGCIAPGTTNRLKGINRHSKTPMPGNRQAVRGIDFSSIRKLWNLAWMSSFEKNVDAKHARSRS